MLHGAGIFTYMTGVILWQMLVRIFHSYGPLPVITTHNPIYRMYNSIYNQL